MEILSIEEYESLTNTPKEIRGHLFSLYDKTIIEDDDIVGWDTTMVIDGKPYNWFQLAYTSAYYKMVDTMKNVFKNLE